MEVSREWPENLLPAALQARGGIDGEMRCRNREAGRLGLAVIRVPAGHVRAQRRAAFLKRAAVMQTGYIGNEAGSRCLYGEQHALVVGVLKRAAGAHGDTDQRVVGDDHRQPAGVRQHLVDPIEQ